MEVFSQRGPVLLHVEDNGPLHSAGVFLLSLEIQIVFCCFFWSCSSCVHVFLFLFSPAETTEGSRSRQ